MEWVAEVVSGNQKSLMKSFNIFMLIAFSSFFAQSQSLSREQIFRKRLSTESIKLTKAKVIYNPAYVSIPYPMGDVPASTGVCTDVVIRAYRKLGFDLQEAVHIDMSKNFNIYPKVWGRKTTDKNIDHRRVPNLMKFFGRKGRVLPISVNPSDYKAGEIVCWELSKGITHIGLLIEQKSKDAQRNLVVHNIGSGQVVEDCLFDFTIIGHYYFCPN